MTERQMLKTIKEMIVKYGATSVATTLGVRDPRTPIRWIEDEKIPKFKHESVAMILGEPKKKYIIRKGRR